MCEHSGMYSLSSSLLGFCWLGRLLFLLIVFCRLMEVATGQVVVLLWCCMRSKISKGYVYIFAYIDIGNALTLVALI